MADHMKAGILAGRPPMLRELLAGISGGGVSPISIHNRPWVLILRCRFDSLCPQTAKFLDNLRHRCEGYYDSGDTAPHAIQNRQLHHLETTKENKNAGNGTE